MKLVRRFGFATFALLVAPLSSAHASDAGYSTVVAKIGGAVAAIYTGTHTDREWVRVWKAEGASAVRNVELTQASIGRGNVKTNYKSCMLETADHQTATLTINCQSSEVGR